MNKEIVLASLRRLVRNFVSTFIITFIVFFQGFNSWAVVGNTCKTGFSPCLETIWAIAMFPAFISALVGGVTASGKLIREILRENGYEDLAKKIVF